MDIARVMRKISEKIWGGRTPSEILSKRFKIFVLLGIFLIVISKLLYLAGITFPNLELVIPALVVIGSFSLFCGPTKFSRRVNRYFGAIAIVSVCLVDLVFWGFNRIFFFTWSGFAICWLVALNNKLSMFDKFKKLLWRTTLTAAVAIIIFDIYAGIIGWSLVGGAGLVVAFFGQIPFTLYHLCSLVFIPPLVGLGKLMVRVKVPAAVAVKARAGVRTHIE